MQLHHILSSLVPPWLHGRLTRGSWAGLRFFGFLLPRNGLSGKDGHDALDLAEILVQLAGYPLPQLLLQEGAEPRLGYPLIDLVVGSLFLEVGQEVIRLELEPEADFFSAPAVVILVAGLHGRGQSLVLTHPVDPVRSQLIVPGTQLDANRLAVIGQAHADFEDLAEQDAGEVASSAVAATLDVAEHDVVGVDVRDRADLVPAGVDQLRVERGQGLVVEHSLQDALGHIVIEPDGGALHLGRIVLVHLLADLAELAQMLTEDLAVLRQQVVQDLDVPLVRGHGQDQEVGFQHSALLQESQLLFETPLPLLNFLVLAHLFASGRGIIA